MVNFVLWLLSTGKWTYKLFKKLFLSDPDDTDISSYRFNTNKWLITLACVILVVMILYAGMLMFNCIDKAITLQEQLDQLKAQLEAPVE